MNIIDQIMKTTTRDLLEMDHHKLESLIHNLESMKEKINLTCKGLESIKTLKEKHLH
jgi:hypothetical protein